MFEYLVVIGIVVVIVLLAQVMRWCRNIYNLLAIQNNNLRLVLSCLTISLEEGTNKEKREKIEQIDEVLKEDSADFTQQLK